MITLARIMGLDLKEIARRREKFGFTLQEAATRAQNVLRKSGSASPFTRQRWSDLEAGRYSDPRLSTIEAVAGALECEIGDLIAKKKR